MTYNVDGILLCIATLLFLGMLICLIQAKRMTIIIKQLMISLLIALCVITCMQAIMIYTTMQKQPLFSNEHSLSNEDFFALLTYDERDGDVLSMQTSQLVTLANKANVNALHEVTNDFSNNLEERLTSIRTLIHDYHLTAQQTQYLMLYEKGLSHYLSATDHLKKANIQQAKRQLLRGLQEIERAQVIINAM